MSSASSSSTAGASTCAEASVFFAATAARTAFGMGAWPLICTLMESSGAEEEPRKAEKLGSMPVSRTISLLTSLMEPGPKTISTPFEPRRTVPSTPLMERSLLRSIRSGSSVRILSLVMQMSFAFTLSLPPRASRTCSATSVFAICAKPFLPAAHSSKRPSPQGLPSLPHLFKCVEQSIGLSQTRHGVWLAMTP